MSASGPLDEQMARWRLAPDGDPFETNSSWLWFVRYGDKRALLKAFKPGSDEAPSARYFAAHRGNGTARVLEHDANAILIERIFPGTRLVRLSTDGRDDAACHIICDTIEKLQSSGASTVGWPGHDEHLASFRRHPVLPLTPNIVARAEALFCELDRSQDKCVLLHGDLHHENILFDDERGWLAVDPKGEVGELAYELAAPLRNPLDDRGQFQSEAQMARRLDIYCERLDLDRQRVLGWCFARNASAALWDPDSETPPTRGTAWAAATLSAFNLLNKGK